MTDTNGDRHRDISPLFIILGVVVTVIVFMTLFVKVVSSQQSAADQKAKTANAKAALLQTSVDNLRQRILDDATAATQDRRFFELVRELLIAPTESQRDALLNRLKGFKFVEPTPQQSATTHKTSKPRVTSTTRAPPASTTTTTSTTQPRSVPPTTCVIVPVLNRQICH